MPPPPTERVPWDVFDRMLVREALIRDTSYTYQLGLLADAAGVTPKTVWRWRQAGGVPVWQADRICRSLGTHIDVLWQGNDWLCDA